MFGTLTQYKPDLITQVKARGEIYTIQSQKLTPRERIAVSVYKIRMRRSIITKVFEFISDVSRSAVAYITAPRVRILQKKLDGYRSSNLVDRITISDLRSRVIRLEAQLLEIKGLK